MLALLHKRDSTRHIVLPAEFLTLSAAGSHRLWKLSIDESPQNLNDGRGIAGKGTEIWEIVAMLRARSICRYYSYAEQFSFL